MATIDNLEIQVTASAESAASALDRLASSAGRLRGAATQAGGGLRDLAAGAKDAGTATQEAGQQAGNAEKHTRNYGRAAEEAGKAAKRGTAGISSFWQALKRVAYYRFIRTIIKEITSAFKEGFGAVYQWSKSVGGSFAANIDSIKSSVNLLKGSLGALAVPLINSLTPAINGVINVLITMINAFNIAIAAINGQDTYTMAVRGANAVANSVGNVANGLSDVASNAEDASKAMRTILGFDEINKLQAVKDGGSSSGSTGGSTGGGGGIEGITFVEKPLEGIWKKISDITDGMPDWLKWLLTGTALVGGFKLISWLIDKIKDFLGWLVSFNIPDWFKWLFGPKDGDNPGIDIPDHIDIPDGKIKVDVEKGDWSALDELSGKSVYVSPKLDNQGGVLFNKLKDEWDAARTPLYVSPKLDNSAAVLYTNFKSEWDAQGSKVLYFSPKLDNGAETLYTNFKNEWDNSGSKTLYFSPKLDNTAKTLYDGFIKDWNDAGSKTLYFSPKLDNTAKTLFENFKKAWDAIESLSLYMSPKLDNTADALFNVFETQWNAGDRSVTVKVTPEWDGNSFGGATGGGGSTAGGGAGRFNVPVSFSAPTPEEASNLFGRLKEAWDAGVVAVDKGLNVVVRPVAKKAGDLLSSYYGKIGEWLFGNGETPETSVTVNGAPGAGFSGVQATGNCFSLNPLAPASATINGVPGTGFASELSGTNKYTLAGIEDANATVNASVGYASGVKKSSLLDLFTRGGTVTADGTKLGGGVKQGSILNLFIWKNKVTATGSQLGKNITKESVLKKFTWKNKVTATGSERGSNTSKDSPLHRFNWSRKVTASGASLGSGVSSDAALNLFTWAKSITITAINIAGDALKSIAEKVQKAIEQGAKAAGAATGGVISNGRFSRFASGGIIDNGFVQKLPHYAGGTMDAHGTLFVAGEAGPEILGHIGGRTEILNQSQLAQTMYAAVRSAMSGVKIAATMYSGSAGSDESDYETMYRAMYDAFTDAMSGSEQRDREKVALMREIAAKEFTAEVSAQSVNRANTRLNRRAGMTIVPVGT